MEPVCHRNEDGTRGWSLEMDDVVYVLLEPRNDHDWRASTWVTSGRPLRGFELDEPGMAMRYAGFPQSVTAVFMAEVNP